MLLGPERWFQFNVCGAAGIDLYLCPDACQTAQYGEIVKAGGVNTV